MRSLRLTKEEDAAVKAAIEVTGENHPEKKDILKKGIKALRNEVENYGSVRAALLQKLFNEELREVI